MMLTVSLLVAIAAFVCVVLSALNKCPLWVGVLLLSVLGLLGSVPFGR